MVYERNTHVMTLVDQCGLGKEQTSNESGGGLGKEHTCDDSGGSMLFRRKTHMQ